MELLQPRVEWAESDNLLLRGASRFGAKVALWT
jgi:hypothetical protein